MCEDLNFTPNGLVFRNPPYPQECYTSHGSPFHYSICIVSKFPLRFFDIKLTLFSQISHLLHNSVLGFFLTWSRNSKGLVGLNRLIFRNDIFRIIQILLYGCETWPVRVADERILGIFDNDSIRHILSVRRRDCVPFVELRRRICLTRIPAQLVQRRLRWFDHAARRPEGELIKDLLLPTPPLARGADELEASWRPGLPRSRPTWNRSPDRESSATHDGERTGCLTSMSALLVQRRLHWFGHAAKRPEGPSHQGPSPAHTNSNVADLESLSRLRVFGHARWKKDWVKVSNELAQDRRAWNASLRDVVNSIGDAGSTRPGWMPTQVQVVSILCYV